MPQQGHTAYIQTQQDKINLLIIMVAGETHDGVRAVVGKAVKVKVPDMQELGKLLLVMESIVQANMVPR